MSFTPHALAIEECQVISKNHDGTFLCRRGDGRSFNAAFKPEEPIPGYEFTLPFLCSGEFSEIRSEELNTVCSIVKNID